LLRRAAGLTRNCHGALFLAPALSAPICPAIEPDSRAGPFLWWPSEAQGRPLSAIAEAMGANGRKISHEEHYRASRVSTVGATFWRVEAAK
jgi:hypothetical protein